MHLVGAMKGESSSEENCWFTSTNIILSDSVVFYLAQKQSNILASTFSRVQLKLKKGKNCDNITSLMSREISPALREEQRGPAGGSVGDQPTDKDMWSGSGVISAPFLLPRTAAHRKSESTHTHTQR